jgi:hypothetical protein
MMNITTWWAANDPGVTINLNNFEPAGGYELFLKNLCKELGQKFIDWHQGIESGIGHIVYRDQEIVVFWTDFPFALSFDCINKAMADELQNELINYFHLHTERWASAWKEN